MDWCLVVLNVGRWGGRFVVWSGLVSTGLNWSGAAASTYVVPTSWPAGMSGPVNYVLTSTSSLVAWQSSTGRTGALYVHVCTPACTEY